jgi:hypothetical protein
LALALLHLLLQTDSIEICTKHGVSPKTPFNVTAWYSFGSAVSPSRDSSCALMSALGPEAMGTAAKVWHRCRCAKTDGGAPMTQVDELSRSLIAFEQNSTMVVVLEMSQSSWLAAGVVPGIERRPLKKLDPLL